MSTFTSFNTRTMVQRCVFILWNNLHHWKLWMDPNSNLFIFNEDLLSGRNVYNATQPQTAALTVIFQFKVKFSIFVCVCVSLEAGAGWLWRNHLDMTFRAPRSCPLTSPPSSPRSRSTVSITTWAKRWCRTSWCSGEKSCQGWQFGTGKTGIEPLTFWLEDDPL